MLVILLLLWCFIVCKILFLGSRVMYIEYFWVILIFVSMCKFIIILEMKMKIRWMNGLDKDILNFFFDLE